MQVFPETTLDRFLYKLYLGPVLCFLHFLTSQNEMNLLTLLNFFTSLDLPGLQHVLRIKLSQLYFSITCAFLSLKKIFFCDCIQLLYPCVSFTSGDAYTFSVP